MTSVFASAMDALFGDPNIGAEVLPERVPTDGLLILRDGEPGEPEVTLSPLRYHYQNRCERVGRIAERLETREKTNETQRRMLEAVARRSRDRSELVDRLRDGEF